MRTPERRSSETLTLTGGPFDRGFQHGHARREAIARRVEHSVLRPAIDLQDAGGGGLEAMAAPWLSCVEEAAPAVAAELRGIAEGSERLLAEIVLLNAFEAFELRRQVELGGCTTVAVPGYRGAIVAQTWDANPDLAATLEIHRHDPDRGPGLVMLASPGGLGWIGMNSAGVALATNDLLTPATAIGVPSQVVRRLILETASVEAAAQVLQGRPHVAGRAYAIGDAEGSVLVAETAAEETGTSVEIHGRPLAHTNHALRPEIAAWESAELLAETYPSTRGRLERALVLLADSREHDIDDVRAILCDHVDYPQSICRHATPREPTITAAAAVFDCGQRTAEFAIGNPCTTEYVAVQL